MKKKTFLTCLMLAAGILSVATYQVQAQPNGGGGGGFGGGGFGGGGRGGVLTQEQRQQITTALQGNEEMTALNTKLAAAQKDALAAVMAKDATDDAVKAKLKAVSDIQTEIAFLRYTKGVKAVVPTLTDDQKSQISSAPPAMNYNSLFGGMGGMGGRRGGGGPGGGGGGN